MYNEPPRVMTQRESVTSLYNFIVQCQQQGLLPWLCWAKEMYRMSGVGRDCADAGYASYYLIECQGKSVDGATQGQGLS